MDELLKLQADIQVALKTYDYETAHCLESKMYTLTLQMIAEGHPHPADLAKFVLVTQDWDMVRWFA